MPGLSFYRCVSAQLASTTRTHAPAPVPSDPRLCLRTPGCASLRPADAWVNGARVSPWLRPACWRSAAAGELAPLQAATQKRDYLTNDLIKYYYLTNDLIIHVYYFFIFIFEV